MSLLFIIAAAPAVALMCYIYKKDSVEKEPVGLLVKLVFFGALSIIPAAILEILAAKLLGFVLPEGNLVYFAIENFLGVALIEEGFKYLALKLGSWKHRAFNFRFDGVVYAVCTSLGFALVENILYVFDGSAFTAFSRALTAVPAHAIFGVFMGIFYGKAKHYANFGDMKSAKKCLNKALWIPVLIHGFYDLCLSVGSVMAVLTFFILLVAMYIVAFNAVKKAAYEDIPITGFWGYYGSANNDDWDESR